MEHDYLFSVKSYHAKHVSPLIGEPVGCSDAQIMELEREFGFPLPLAYKQYLFWMGCDHHGIFVGCDWFLSNVRANTEYLPELLAENNVDWKLPDHYLVFMGHQGYIAAYFSLPCESDDPAVYLYNEGHDSQTVFKHESFTDFLLRDLAGMAFCLERNDR